MGEATKQKLLELADRAEGASGPSGHLDTQIFILLDPDAQHIVGQKPGRFPQEPIYGPRSTFWDWALDESVEPPEIGAVPAFTSSLDAAMTLADGLQRFGGVPGLLREAMDRVTTLPVMVSQIPPAEYAGLLARYFSAASLRALASQGGDDGDR
jgi:hypothetical protein